MSNKETKTFEFKDLDDQMEKQLEENIKQHEEVKAQPKKESKPAFDQKFSKKFEAQPKKIASRPKFEGLKRFWNECKRVLTVTKKPDKAEFNIIVKVSALGMAIIGVVGFLISLLKELIL